MIYLGIRFPYTHDITRLLSLAEQGGQKVPDGVEATGALSDYAVESRYPGLAEPVTEDEYSEALALSERLVQWAETVIKKGQSKRRSLSTWLALDPNLSKRPRFYGRSSFLQPLTLSFLFDMIHSVNSRIELYTKAEFPFALWLLP